MVGLSSGDLFLVESADHLVLKSVVGDSSLPYSGGLRLNGTVTWRKGWWCGGAHVPPCIGSACLEEGEEEIFPVALLLT